MFLTVAAVCLTAGLTFGQGGYTPPIPPKKEGTAKPSTGRPAMVLPETEWSWGDVLQGDKVSHTFNVKNTGDEVLRITQVKPGCGCTSKNFDREIAPGAEGKIELVIDTTKLRGKTVRKYATIFTNDPTQARAKVFMSGSVTTFVNTEPANVRLVGLSGDSLEGGVTLSPGVADTTFTIESVVPKSKRVEVTEVKDMGEGRFELKVRAAQSDRPIVMRDQLEVTVKTPDGQLRKAMVPVTVEHRDRITLQPRGNVVFQKRQTQQLLNPSNARPVQRDVHIFSGRDDIRFKLLNVELLDLPEGVFSVSTTTVKPEQRYRITIKLNEYQSERTVRGRLRITTDDPETPVREMRVYAQFGDPARPGGVTGAPGRSPGSVKPAGLPPGTIKRVPAPSKGKGAVRKAPAKKPAAGGSK
ncbi:MAG: DUF1573 domain-containing protein, partial [Planctomycetota bacterium]